jgi:hypothetical protein
VYGRQAVHYACEALSGNWHMRQRLKSPSYTTNWAEALTIMV